MSRGDDQIVATVSRLHERAWATAPDAVVLAPGRVNLIGDHVDYAHYPVLPMAIGRVVAVAGSSAGPSEGPRIERDAVVGVSASERGIARVLASTDLTEISGWGSYVAAAAARTGIPAGGAKISVAATLPSTGGLSSSSALAMGAIATLRRLREPRHALTSATERSVLVEMTVAAERALGVAGGTMDQTVIAHARSGAALLIRFSPPSMTPIPMSDGVAFVVAASGDTAAKAAGSQAAYNRLSVAARSCAALVAAELGMDPVSADGVCVALGDLAVSNEIDNLVASLPEHAAVAEVARRVEVHPDVLIGGARGIALDEPLAIHTVGVHVVGEGTRVEAAAQVLAEGSQLGEIFDASQASMCTIGVVTPGLEAVTAAMRHAGAWGARVTGAGFGGYAVATCPPDRRGDVIAAAKNATGGPAFEVTPSEGIRYA
jgi:galactokinase